MQNNQENKLILLEDLGYLYPTEISSTKKKFGLYKCYCGNEFKTRIDCVNSGNTRSCGCFLRLTAFQKGKNAIIHGLSKHPLYKIWFQIVQRCTNINHLGYKDYGGRGITVCDEWLNMEMFYNDMIHLYKKGLSIDRIDNNKGYSKDNCRWTSKTVQNRNTRKIQTNNKSGYRGVYFCNTFKKWVSKIGVNKKYINLGYFIDKTEAAMAYDKYVLDNNLEHTRNFS